MQAPTREENSTAATAVVAASIMTCATLLLSCSATSTTADPAYSTALPTVTADAADARGTIVASTTDTGFDKAAFPDGTSAAKMTYNSVSGVTGESTEVSGALFVPGGIAPAGGRPIVAYAHGTVGIAPGCAPTESPLLSGDAGAVSFLLQQGYAVAYTDYQGLGSDVPTPPHPYLEPRTAASDVIDSVRAARNLDPTLSADWVAVGSSQGGQAAWAANELDGVYGDGLNLLGAAVLAPALDISPVVAEAQTSTLSGGQKSLYPMIVEGAAAVDPTIDPTQHLHGVYAENTDALVSCGADSAAARLAAEAQNTTGDTAAADPAAARQLTSRLQDYSLPKAASSAPILAVYGGADDIVLPAWTEVALGRACGYGDTVLRVRLEGQGHSVDPGTLLETWIADRFAGLPAPSNC